MSFPFRHSAPGRPRGKVPALRVGAWLALSLVLLSPLAHRAQDAATPPAAPPAAPAETAPAEEPAPAPPAAPATDEPAAEIRPPRPGHRFPNGETLVYQVDWRIFDAGVATLRTEAAGREQRIAASATSTGVVSLLYAVRDRFEAFLDPRTFCSRQIAKHTEEGYRRRETSIRFDAARRKSVLEEKNLKSGALKKVENDTPACVTDVLSGIYYLRSLPLEPGDTYRFPLSDGGQTVEVRALVEDREEIQVPAGAFQTLRVGPAPTEPGQVWIWYSDDASRLPVQMRARMIWGTLTFRLERIEQR